jgi:hypothetical protein
MGTVVESQEAVSIGGRRRVDGGVEVNVQVVRVGGRDGGEIGVCPAVVRVIATRW